MEDDSPKRVTRQYRQRRIRPTAINDISPEDLSWLAGWLEGEGCFAPYLSNGTHRSMKISGCSTDNDVIGYIHRMTGIGRVHYTAEKEHTKACWTWQVGARADVVALAEMLIPLMHKRRRERIEEILTWASWWSHLETVEYLEETRP